MTENKAVRFQNKMIVVAINEHKKLKKKKIHQNVPEDLPSSRSLKFCIPHDKPFARQSRHRFPHSEFRETESKSFWFCVFRFVQCERRARRPCSWWWSDVLLRPPGALVTS